MVKCDWLTMIFSESPIKAEYLYIIALQVTDLKKRFVEINHQCIMKKKKIIPKLLTKTCAFEVFHIIYQCRCDFFHARARFLALTHTYIGWDW